MKFPFFSGRNSGNKSSSAKALRRQDFLRRPFGPERLEDRALFATMVEFRIDAVPAGTAHTDGVTLKHPGQPGANPATPTLQIATNPTGTFAKVDKGTVFELRVYTKNDVPESRGVALGILDLGLDLTKLTPVNNEVQNIKINNATGGTFSLTYGASTQTVDFDGLDSSATLANLTAALKTLVGTKNVEVTTVSGNQEWNVAFVGTLLGQNVNALTINTTNLTGTGVTGVITSTDAAAARTTAQIREAISASPVKTPNNADRFYNNDLPEIATLIDNPTGLDTIVGAKANGTTSTTLASDQFPNLIEREFLTIPIGTLDGTGTGTTSIALMKSTAGGSEAYSIYFYTDANNMTKGGNVDPNDVLLGSPFQVQIVEYVTAQADLINAGRATSLGGGAFRLNVLADNGNGADTNSNAAFGLNVTTDPITTSLAGSTAVRAADGQSITYTPPAGFSLAPAGTTTGFSDTFTYKIVTKDAANAGKFAYTDTATVTVFLTAPNLPPVNTLPTAPTLSEGQALSLSGISVADPSNTTAPIKTTFTFTDANNNAVAGTLLVNGVPQTGTNAFTITDTVSNINTALLGGFQFTPSNQDFNGTLKLTMLTDDQGSGTGLAAGTDSDVLNITVTAVNDAPTISGVPANGSITEEQTLSLTSLVLADVDVAEGNGTHRLDLTITANNTGDNINYGSFAFTQNGVTIITNAAGNLVLNGTLANLNLALGTLIYTPDPAHLGDYLFTITANDGGNNGLGGALSGVQTFNLTVNPTARPLAVDDIYNDSVPGYSSAAEAALKTLTNVLTNDKFRSGATPSIGSTFTNITLTPAAVLAGTTFNVPSNFIFRSGTDVVVDLTQIPDFFGTVDFDYTISDSSGIIDDPQAAIGHVKLLVTNVNDAPVLAIAGPLNLTGTEDTNVVIDLSTYFTDPDKDALTVQLVSESTGTGTIVSNVNGVITYKPPLNFNGTQTLMFRAFDGSLTSSGILTVNIDLAPANDPPTAGSKTVTILEDSGANAITVAELVSDVDAVDTDSAITLESVTANVAGGTIVKGTFASDGFTYAPPPNFNGTIRLTYTIKDTGNVTAQGVITVNVTAQNDAPVAVNDGVSPVISVTENTTTSIPVIGNDFDVDADPNNVGIPGTLQSGTTVQIVSGPVDATNAAFGTATVVNNQIRYVAPTTVATPTIVTITYKLTDPSLADSNTATLTFTVNPKNDPPVASDFSVSATEDTDKTFNVFDLGLVSDPDSPRSAWTVEIVTAPPVTAGTLQLGTDGNVTFKPTPNFNGNTSFTYRINDNSTILPANAKSPTRTVSISVAEVNDAPVAKDDIQPRDIGLVINNSSNNFVNDINVLANDGFGPDAATIDGPLKIVSFGTIASPNNHQTEQGGTLTLVDGKLRYVAPAGKTADFQDSFTYTVADRNGAVGSMTASATATFIVQQAVPIDINVSVFQDRPLRPRAPYGDGVRQGVEKGYQNVLIVLTGRNVNGQSVRLVGRTDFNGHYTFKDMLPGQYVVREQQPLTIVDGRDSSPDQQANSNLVRIGSGERFILNIPTVPTSASGNEIDLFYGEMGVSSKYISLEENLASSGPNGLIIATTAGGQSLWNQVLGGFTNLKDVKAKVSSDQQRVRVTFTPLDGSQPTVKTFNLSGASVRLMGSDRNGNVLIRLDGSASDFGLSNFALSGAKSFAQQADEIFGTL